MDNQRHMLSTNEYGATLYNNEFIVSQSYTKECETLTQIAMKLALQYQLLEKLCFTRVGGSKEELAAANIILDEISKIIIKIHSTAGSVNNLNPLYLINAVSEKFGKIEDYEIKRERLILEIT